MSIGDVMGFYEYSSDDTTIYAVKLSDKVAAAGGFSTTVDPRGTSVWPFGARNMRHVYGKSSAGKRTRVPLATAGNTLYTTGGTFSLHDRDYVVEGAIGESRKLNNVA